MCHLMFGTVQRCTLFFGCRLCFLASSVLSKNRYTIQKPTLQMFLKFCVNLFWVFGMTRGGGCKRLKKASVGEIHKTRFCSGKISELDVVGQRDADEEVRCSSNLLDLCSNLFLLVWLYLLDFVFIAIWYGIREGYVRYC